MTASLKRIVSKQSVSGLWSVRAVRLSVLMGMVAISSCSMDDMLRPSVDVGMTTAAVTAPGLQSLVPNNPMMTYPAPMAPEPDYSAVPLTEYPSTPPMAEPAVPFMEPSVAPEMAEPVAPVMVQPVIAPPVAQRIAPQVVPPVKQSVMPTDEAACLRALKKIGAKFRTLPPINDGGACRIDYPVQLSALSGGIQVKPAATLTCAMALSFAQWTKKELAPNARRKYFSGVDTIHQGSSYSCRRINGTNVASEHSKGNAIDIMKIKLNSGRVIDVRKPGLFAFRQKSLLNTVRADGCSYFTTVLGPGYNRDHANHFHFDIKNRNNGYRACR